jgi:hypothetical protein
LSAGSPSVAPIDYRREAAMVNSTASGDGAVWQGTGSRGTARRGPAWHGARGHASGSALSGINLALGPFQPLLATVCDTLGNRPYCVLFGRASPLK